MLSRATPAEVRHLEQVSVWKSPAMTTRKYFCIPAAHLDPISAKRSRQEILGASGCEGGVLPSEFQTVAVYREDYARSQSLVGCAATSATSAGPLPTFEASMFHVAALLDPHVIALFKSSGGGTAESYPTPLREEYALFLGSAAQASTKPSISGPEQEDAIPPSRKGLADALLQRRRAGGAASSSAQQSAPSESTMDDAGHFGSVSAAVGWLFSATSADRSGASRVVKPPRGAADSISGPRALLMTREVMADDASPQAPQTPPAAKLHRGEREEHGTSWIS